MLGKQKSMAYFRRVVMNSLKNEYRQNDNAAKHVILMGDELLQMGEIVDFDRMIEIQLSDYGPEGWLLFIENQQLHKALCNLEKTEVLLLFLKYYRGYSQAELATQLGLSQQAVSKRQKNILKKMRDYF